VGVGNHEPDNKDHERGSTKPGGEIERKRSDCDDGRWGAGVESKRERMKKLNCLSIQREGKL